MTHHQIIRQEIEHASKAIAELSDNIEKLSAQRDRIASFVEAMNVALASIPEQLEFELDTPQNVIKFDQ
jgi:uncharacterized FlaG/YvyC family protein